MPLELPSQKTKRFAPHEYIFHEGDTGSEVYFILDGTVEVIKGFADAEVILDTLKQGDFFGEMALFGNNKRSASIRAKTHTQVMVISEPVFRAQFKKIPEWFAGMFEVLINRIRQIDAKIITQFKMGIEFSLLNLLYLLVEKYGSSKDKKHRTIQLSLAVNHIKKILGMSVSAIRNKLRGFEFIKLLKIEEKQDLIEIDNYEQFNQFIEYIQVLSETGESKSIAEQLPHIKKDRLSYFHQLIQILYRSKDTPMAI